MIITPSLTLFADKSDEVVRISDSEPIRLYGIIICSFLINSQELYYTNDITNQSTIIEENTSAFDYDL